MPEKYASLDDFWTRIEEPRRAIALQVREILLTTEPELVETLKWNAPSFALNGQDRMTFNLSAANQVRIVFHAGATTKEDKAGDRLFVDETNLLQWQSNIRAIAAFRDPGEVEDRRSDLQAVTRRWLEALT